ncbi:MAG: potassium channel protein [Caulobacteraceae bacterium]|nr:potassium channel protein [Caulobacteraceae bacterium]
MNGADGSPLRGLIAIVAFVMVVVMAATLAYMAAGWPFGDALYMVLLTVYTVGYREVRSVDTPYLHLVTIATIILGCTGMIAVTGSLVQFLTFSQVQRMLGGNRVKSEIHKLHDHVIICGFGRIGLMLARDLATGGVPFVIIDQDEGRLTEARDSGYLCWAGDATDEDTLRAVGVERARVLATVLPSDAANVFITLSARSLNPALQIIARGEAPSTESKLLQAGANQVVLPAHIGAERIAEMVLFPETARFIRGSPRMRELEKSLRDLGLEVDVVTVSESAAVVDRTVEELEAHGKGAFFVIQLNRTGGEAIARPPGDLRIGAGDSLVVVARDGAQVRAVFNTTAEPAGAGGKIH